MAGPGSVISAICGESKTCEDTLKGVYNVIVELEELLQRLDKPIISSFKEPLIKHVHNVDEIRRSMPGDVAGDDELFKYSLSRLILKNYQDRVTPRSRSCPLCGDFPTLILLEKRPSISFEAVEAKSRCICGFERPIERLTCPKCGSRGRENFEVYITPRGEVKIFKCRNCGHVYAELERNGLSDAELQGIHFALRLVFREIVFSEENH